MEEPTAKDGVPAKDTGEGDLISLRLEEIYKRLDAIDAYTAEARAASILAVRSSSPLNIFYCSLRILFSRDNTIYN